MTYAGNTGPDQITRSRRLIRIFGVRLWKIIALFVFRLSEIIGINWK